MTNIMEVKFLGRTLGKGSGWDGDLGSCWWAYDFIPKEGVAIPACECLQLDEDNGWIHTQDKEGNTDRSFDLIELLSTIPRDTQ